MDYPKTWDEYIPALVNRSYRGKDWSRMVDIGTSSLRDELQVFGEAYKQHGLGTAIKYSFDVFFQKNFERLFVKRGKPIKWKDDGHTAQERFEFEMQLWAREPEVDRIFGISGCQSGE